MVKEWFPEMYCDFHEEYPGSHIALGGFRPGCSYGYVSSTFVQAFVNYTLIVEARLLDRYQEPKKNIESLEQFMSSMELPSWQGRRCHTSIDELFGDDILLLAKSSDDSFKRYESWSVNEDELLPTWWFYWFDRDTSDCNIACFRTEDTDEQVRKNFQEFVDGLEYSNRPVPAKGFCGWITF